MQRYRGYGILLSVLLQWRSLLLLFPPFPKPSQQIHRKSNKPFSHSDLLPPSMLRPLPILPNPLRNLSILSRFSSHGAGKGRGGVRQVGPIHLQGLREGHRLGSAPSRVLREEPAGVRGHEVVPCGVFPGRVVEPGWLSGGYTGFCCPKDKEALRNLLANASSSSDVKRHHDGAEPSDGSKRMKPNVAADIKDVMEIKFSVSEIRDTYKDATLSPNWKAFQTVIFNVKGDGLHDSAKIAAFDFDGCLAKTDVRRTGADAWSLMYSSIPEKLKGLYDDGYKLVIFTNESNIERWKNKRQVAVDSKIGRLEKFIKRVEVPIQVFVACGIGGKGQNADPFRKPNIGMWTLLKEHFNSEVAIDMHQSFYVGDAAGRETDHSDADIEFAKAIGLKFHVPEEYFDAR